MASWAGSIPPTGHESQIWHWSDHKPLQGKLQLIVLSHFDRDMCKGTAYSRLHLPPSNSLLGCSQIQSQNTRHYYTHSSELAMWIQIIGPQLNNCRLASRTSTPRSHFVSERIAMWISLLRYTKGWPNEVEKMMSISQAGLTTVCLGYYYPWIEDADFLTRHCCFRDCGYPTITSTEIFFWALFQNVPRCWRNEATAIPHPEPCVPRMGSYKYAMDRARMVQVRLVSSASKCAENNWRPRGDQYPVQ